MKNLIYLFLITVLFCSCKAYKQVVYFKDLDGKELTNQEVKHYQPLQIKKDDLLAINISSLEPKAAAVYNIGNNSSLAEVASENGYLVDENGDVQIPTYGSIHLAGLTTIEAKDLIKLKLDPFLGNSVVNLKLLNFKVSILGDVAVPGVYIFKEEKISLIEAISRSGDLSITGFRDNILLVRENNGKRDFIRLNLNDKDIFNSPYFYLKSNDVIYVQPRNTKYANVDNNYRNLGIVTSGLSIVLVLISIFK